MVFSETRILLGITIDFIINFTNHKIQTIYRSTQYCFFVEKKDTKKMITYNWQ